MRGGWLFVLAGCSFHTVNGTTTGDDAQVHDVAVDMKLPDGPITGPRRKPITIHKTKVMGVLGGFPVWIDLSDPQITAAAQPDGSDIFFTDAGNVAIPYERHYTAGHLTAWVKLDLATTTDTVIYVRYGDPTGVPAPDPTMVF